MSTSAPPSTTLPAFLRQSKADIKAKFVDLEWAQRERLLQGTQQPVDPSTPPSQWSRLTGDAIASRNRYMNVEPYASNRIRLRVAEGQNDYINASPIVLGKRRYIATQGPKDSSLGHFYRMLVGEVRSPAVVVMLTQTHEAGREKCFQYYPLSEEESPMRIEEEEDGWQARVVLEGVEEQVESRSQLRRMRVRTRVRTRVREVGGDGAAAGAEEGGEAEEKQGEQEAEEDEGEWQEELEINHLLFSGWPDFLIPEGDDRTALLELVRLSAKLNAPTSASQPNGYSPLPLLTDQSNPRIIHCSAGVGRSGTFIALDYLFSLLEAGELDGLEEGTDPIAETVDELRKQRMMMVQGESQFAFLYEVLREAVEARNAGESDG